jgi:hypothetical protein
MAEGFGVVFGVGRRNPFQEIGDFWHILRRAGGAAPAGHAAVNDISAISTKPIRPAIAMREVENMTASCFVLSPLLN